MALFQIEKSGAVYTAGIGDPSSGIVVAAAPPPSAEQLARIFGTEEDPVNCAFFFKVGSCRNGDLCNKKHNRPTQGQTLLLSHMYPSTPDSMAISNNDHWDDNMYDRAQAAFEAFYAEVFLEMACFGEIEDVIVLDNSASHMLGNVYLKYYDPADAGRALRGLSGRVYAGQLISAEYTTITDFREARCRKFYETVCYGFRDGPCNFLHIKHIPRAIKRRIIRTMYEEHPEYLKNLRPDTIPSATHSAAAARREKGAGKGHQGRRSDYDDPHGGRERGRGREGYNDSYRGRERDDRDRGGGRERVMVPPNYDDWERGRDRGDRDRGGQRSSRQDSNGLRTLALEDRGGESEDGNWSEKENDGRDERPRGGRDRRDRPRGNRSRSRSRGGRGEEYDPNEPPMRDPSPRGKPQLRARDRGVVRDRRGEEMQVLE